MFARALVAAALLSAAVAADETALIEVETSQRDVGRLAAETARDFALLSEEYAINFGVDRAAGAADGAKALDEIARREIPAVIGRIRSAMRAERSQSRLHLNAALEGQRAILERVSGIIALHGGDLPESVLARRVRALAERQRELAERAGELAPAALGRRYDELDDRTRNELDGLAGRQLDLAGQTAELAARARDAGTADYDAPASALEDAAAGMKEAAARLSQNRIANALARQQAAADRLETLAGSPRETEPAALIEKQRAAIARTEAAESDARLAEAARDQRAIARDAREAAAAAEGLLEGAYFEAAAEAAESAAKKLESARSEPLEGESRRAALADQRKAAELLSGAREAAKGGALEKLASAVEKARTDLARDARDIRDLDALMKQQQALLEETARKSSEDPDRLPEMAPAQEDLEERTRRRERRQAERNRGEPGGRSQRESTGGAAEAMKEARENLEKSRGSRAADSQKRALDALGEKRRRAVRRMLARAADVERLLKAAGDTALGGRAPEPVKRLMEAAREDVGRTGRARRAAEIADTQRRLTEEAAGLREGAESRMKSLAFAEEALANEAAALAEVGEDVAAQFAAAAAGASRKMREAAAILGADDPKRAQGRMREAARIMEAASAARLADSFTSSPAPYRRPSYERGALADGSTATGAPVPAKPWLRRLPGEAASPILQAAEGEFPAGYEDVLKRYYRSLAEEGDR